MAGAGRLLRTGAAGRDSSGGAFPCPALGRRVHDRSSRSAQADGFTDDPALGRARLCVSRAVGLAAPRPEPRVSALRRHALAPERRQPHALAAGPARPTPPGRLGEPARPGCPGARTGRPPRPDDRLRAPAGRTAPAGLETPGWMPARRAAAHARLSVWNGTAGLLPPHAREPAAEQVRPGMGTDDTCE